MAGLQDSYLNEST